MHWFRGICYWVSTSFRYTPASREIIQKHYCMDEKRLVRSSLPNCIYVAIWVNVNTQPQSGNGVVASKGCWILIHLFPSVLHPMANFCFEWRCNVNHNHHWLTAQQRVVFATVQIFDIRYYIVLQSLDTMLYWNCQSVAWIGFNLLQNNIQVVGDMQ